MRWTHPCLCAVALIPWATMAGHAAEVYINATAVAESGSHSAKGDCRVVTTKAQMRGANLPSTAGGSSEPVAMYMLLSYVTAPTPWLLSVQALSPGEAGGFVQNFREQGDWSVTANTMLDGLDTVAVPGGTFVGVRKYKSVLAGAKGDSKAAAAFVNGTRYTWFAQGVGLVRMRYEHANGKVTEAVLLSHSLSGKSENCLPLSVGNRWTYAWKNDYRQEAVIETWKVGGRPESLDSSPPRPRPRDVPGIKAVDADSITLDLTRETVIKIAPDPGKGFHFPYYLHVPRGMDPAADRHLLVETNNTGTASDDFQVHDNAAARLALRSHATRMAATLGTPLLVPVFPRPRDQWQAYTHSLDEDTLLIASGPLQRIDLQLVQMIRDARALLRRNHVSVQDKVMMHGYSASGVFANRFPVLHPEVVRAVATGGVNAIPIFPITQWRGTTLSFPVGIADLKKIANIDFDERAYKQVSQYLYMGYLDRNDTTLSRDAFCEEHAELIRERIGAEMPKRWQVSQSVYRELGLPAQCVTYNGSGHEIKSEMIDDVVQFFSV